MSFARVVSVSKDAIWIVMWALRERQVDTYKAETSQVLMSNAFFHLRFHAFHEKRMKCQEIQLIVRIRETHEIMMFELMRKTQLSEFLMSEC